MFLSLWPTAHQFSACSPPPHPRASQFSGALQKGSLILGKQFTGKAQLSESPHTDLRPSSNSQVHVCFYSQVPRCHLDGHSLLSWDYTGDCAGLAGDCAWANDFIKKNSLDPSLRSHEHTSRFWRRKNVAFRPTFIMQHFNCLFICWSQLMDSKFLENEIAFCWSKTVLNIACFTIGFQSIYTLKFDCIQIIVWSHTCMFVN